MVGASTQQAVDRVVGTAAVVGLSVVLLRWLTNRSLDQGSNRRERNRYSWMPWWWPVIALQRRSKRKSTDAKVQEEGRNDDGKYEHQGSCHCGSINFVLRGPQSLRTVDSPGKIRYPHIPTSADRFQLLRGEEDMRFYYEEAHDDSSSITFEHAGEERTNDAHDAAGAHVFCGNCGVHVFHADRSTGELEVNANCLDGGEKQHPDGIATITMRKHGKTTPRAQSSLSSTPEGEAVDQMARSTPIETVSEHEPFLGTARVLESLDDRDGHGDGSLPRKERKESISSDPTTLSETYSFSMLAEHDDLSMGSSSVTGANMPYHSSLSVASREHLGHDRTDRNGLPPLGPPRTTSSSDRSVRTMPAWLGDGPRPRYPTSSVGGGWSVASIETSNDLDGGDAGKATVSPTTRDQMKKRLGRYMSQKGK